MLKNKNSEINIKNKSVQSIGDIWGIKKYQIYLIILVWHTNVICGLTNFLFFH